MCSLFFNKKKRFEHLDENEQSIDKEVIRQKRLAFLDKNMTSNRWTPIASTTRYKQINIDKQVERDKQVVKDWCS